MGPGTNYTVSIDQISSKGKTNVGSVIFGFTTVPEAPPEPSSTQPSSTQPTPTPENHPPEAQSQQVTTEAGKPVDIALGAIDNDTGDSLTAEIVTPPQPNSGSLGQIDQNTGNVTFTPAAGFSGNDSFTFKVIDNHQAESNVGTVTITVTPSVSTTPTQPSTQPTPTPENHPPEAQSQQVTTEAGKPVDIALGAIDNDTGDSLTAEIVTPPQPNSGSLGQIDQNTGNVTFTPAAGFSGNDSFTFKVIDNHQAESNVGTVTITVTPSVSTTPTQPSTQPTPTPENHPPEAQSQQVTTEAGKPVDIALGAIDNDTGDSLTAEIVTPPQPNSGSLGQIDQNTGNVTFTPAAGFSGNDSFTFKVIDNHQAESNVGTVTITVTPSVPPTQPPPKLIESVPQNGSSDVSTTIDKIEATFDDKVNIGSAIISLKDDSGKDIQVTTNAQDSKVIIIPQSKLSPKTHYTILFDQIKTDNKSNPGSTSLSFTTSATTNNPPLIEKLNASPSSAKVGDLVMLSVAKPNLKDENLSSLGLQWQQTSGIPTVNLTLSSDNKTASFTAPEVKQNTSLIFKLTATDEENQTASKGLTVNVMAPPPNRPPGITVIANATDPKPGQGIEMKASVQDEQPLSVKLTWQQTSGIPTVNLTLSSDNKTAELYST